MNEPPAAFGREACRTNTVSLVLLVIVALAASGCAQQVSITQLCSNNECKVSVTGNSPVTVTVFDYLDVDVANITDQSVDITIGGETKSLRKGDEATIGGHGVVVTSVDMDQSRHRVKFTITR